MKLITKHEAAQILNVSYKTVEAWGKQGKFPYVKFGDGPKAGIRYLESDVYKFIAERYVDNGSNIRPKRKAS